MIDSKIYVPECKRILQLMSGITNKTTKRDVKIIAHQIANSTREWLYADGSLNTFVTYLCLSPNGDRENMLNVVNDMRARLNKIIDDPSEFGKLPWNDKGSMLSMADRLNLRKLDFRKKETVSHVFTKSEDVKTREALKAEYSQNLDDWL